MKTTFYVYVESKQSAAFQFVPLQTREQADRFVLSVTQRCQSFRAYVVDLQYYSLTTIRKQIGDGKKAYTITNN